MKEHVFSFAPEKRASVLERGLCVTKTTRGGVDILSMSGPVVNPIVRRSHTKSKNGCQNCKSRRVKCDEMQPDCRNCVRSGRTCKYDTKHIAGDEIAGPTAAWPEATMKAVKEWRESGQPPFPHLRIPESPNWHGLSEEELRYVHYFSVIASMLEVSGTRSFCLWWSEFPMSLQLALHHKFAAYAMLAQSADRYASITKSSEAFAHAVKYKNLAIQGANQALSEFSRHNADAILFSSICFSSCETDWRAWKAIMEGIIAVVGRMQSWIPDSGFGMHLKMRQHCTRILGFAVPDDDARQLIRALFVKGLSSLNALIPCPKASQELAALVRQLRDVLRTVHDHSSNWSADEQYRLIHPFSQWCNRWDIPYISISQCDVIVLASLAHFFSVVVTLELAFTLIDLPLLSPIRMRGVIEINDTLQKVPGIFCSACKEFHSSTQLMAYPMQTLMTWRKLRGCTRLASNA
ncbi:hypothetical protein NA57DRAFT_74899 [Rhizodiscina lignyota]|uniref:Zn(2)-C6 fungal-type domain-containing protein n=1 Tax=Rhizodiscina lignyota TaxID=1504668 RepID=A0A9P4IHI5_9PEZI|nr:hypothetical protein NA57DRAFT_74899 [Rhizodiscina lignyota]